MGTVAIYLMVLGGIGLYVWSLRGSGAPKKPKTEHLPNETPTAPAPGQWPPQGAPPGIDERGYGAPRDPRGPGWGA